MVGLHWRVALQEKVPTMTRAEVQVTAYYTFQVKLARALAPAESVTTTVTV